MYFKPNHIELHELLPKNVYEKLYPQYGDRMWLLFGIRPLVTLHRLRERYGPCYLNNWYWGGLRQYRGYRPPGCKIGVPLSLHRSYKAFDLTFRNYTAREVREDIVLRPDSAPFEFISAIERDVGWLHIDFRQTFALTKRVVHMNRMTFFRRLP